jgi:hypothetical protein
LGLKANGGIATTDCFIIIPLLIKVVTERRIYQDDKEIE